MFLTSVLLAKVLGAQTPARSYTPSLLRVDRLPQLGAAIAKTGSFSSYDRTGGNDDGFSGRYSFLRKEGDGLVIAELKGAGALTRIWTPTPTSDPVEFYFDGESAPRLRLPFRDLFSGKTPPFVPPLAAPGAGGYVSYVPLEFTRSIKVIVRAKLVQFYQINYVLYQPGTLARAYHAEDTVAPPRVETNGRRSQSEHVVLAGKAVTLWETQRPGRIVSLKLGPPAAFAGRERSLALRIYWDGSSRPAVETPVGDFFGYSFGTPATRSLLIGTDEQWNYFYFPMPFSRSARIELVSERPDAVTVRSEIVVSEEPRAPHEGWFHTAWHRENPTTPGQPFTFLAVQGIGKVVGATLQAQGRQPGRTDFFEGDDQATIDGDLTIHGTGSEDFFNGGWYDVPGRWFGRLSLPFSGCLEYKKSIARTSGYRLMLADAYFFQKSILLTIEHGPQGNNVSADYTGVTYFYLDQASGADQAGSPGVSRAVTEPTEFVLVPGWQDPVYAFSFEHATLTKVRAKIGNDTVRYLSFRQTGKADMLEHFVALTADAPQEGQYAVSIEGITGPEKGQVQLLVNDQPVGNRVDFYAPQRKLSGARKLADLPLSQGANQLFFALVGHNAQSRGEGFDIVRVRCKRLMDRDITGSAH